VHEPERRRGVRTAGSLAFLLPLRQLRGGAATDPTDGVRTRIRDLVRAARQAPSGILRLRRGGDFIASYQAEWRHLFAAIRSDLPIECTDDEGRARSRSLTPGNRRRREAGRGRSTFV
jgi:hypothetical protein